MGVGRRAGRNGVPRVPGSHIIFFPFFYMRTYSYILGTHYLGKVLLMITHKIYFLGEK